MINASAPETSIIIRAYNEERWLPEVFAALHQQKYRDFEVLLVDSGSIDRTRDIAAANGARIMHLRSEDFTFGYSLNLGIAEAKGQFMAIISAHAIPTDENWLENLIRPLRNPEVAMVFGGQRGHAISKFSESLDFERIFPNKEMITGDEDVVANNANSAIRKSLWEEHPFDEGLPGLEDAEWVKYWVPRGKQVLYKPEACIYHVHTESWPQVRHRFHREGVAGRWIANRLLRHIPREIFREIYWTSADLGIAMRRGKLQSEIGNILRYRHNKAIGIVQGILDSRQISNTSKRAQMQFEKGISAVVIRGPHSAAIEPYQLPIVKPSEVLIRVGYVGMCATDVEIHEGRLGYYKSGMAKYPIVPGHELSGTIVSLGTKVAGYEVGDRVVVEAIQGCGKCAQCAADNVIACAERKEMGVMGLNGGYAEFLVTRARYLHKLPLDVQLSEAALAEPCAVVIKGLRRLAGSTGTQNARRCAVIGAGTIGHLAAKVLALRGHEVTVFDKNPTKLGYLQDPIHRENALAGLERFDWIVEATGDQGLLSAALQGSQTGAAILLLGFPYAQKEFNFESVVAFDKVIVGSVGSAASDFDEALQTLARIDTQPFLQTAFPLEDFHDAWHAMRSGKHLKVMLHVDPQAV